MKRDARKVFIRKAVNIRSFDLKNIGFLVIILLCSYSLIGQEYSPQGGDVEVTTTQFLNFGSFTGGNSRGSVSVDHHGTRSYTGDVYLLNIGETVSPALFEVKANPGVILNVLTQNDIYLRGDNGGRLHLQLDSFSPNQMFISTVQPPHANLLYVGGTLFLENSSANPPGRYSGSFTITVVHQ